MTDYLDKAYLKANFEDFCQLCMRNNKGKVNKFRSLSNDESFCTKFRAVFRDEISITDKLPSNICRKCYRMLIEYLEFHDAVLASRRQLEEISSSADVKLELVEQATVGGTVEILLKDDNLIPKFEEKSEKEETAPEDKPKKVSIRKKSKQRSPRKYKQCQECGKLVQNLRAHKVLHQANPYICHYCNRKILMKINLLMHLKVHLQIKNYNCTICPKTFVNPSSLKRHLQMHSGSKNYKCDLCDKAFNNSGMVKAHKTVVHFKKAKIICEICQNRFYNKIHYTHHMSTVHAERPQCEICKKLLKNQKSLDKHKLTHGIGVSEFVCHICTKVCSTKNSLLGHIKCHNRPEGRAHQDAMRKAKNQNIMRQSTDNREFAII